MRTVADREGLALLVHEVRSPVAALMAISQAFAEGDVDTWSVRELARLALGASRGVKRIVEDAGLGPLRRGDVDLARITRDAVAAAVLEGGQVRASIEPGILRIDGDEIRLRQALDNLIRNALVHSGSKDDIVVSAWLDGEFVRVSVADAGRGIPKADQARMFEPGARLVSSQRGAGLGLAVARSIARAHGGALSVESAEGSGATFTMTLPLEGIRPTDKE